MHNYTRQVFKTLSSKEKKAYIDRLIDSHLDMNKQEIEFASKDQLRKYFDGKFRTRRNFDAHELKYLSFDQILDYLEKNNNMIELYILKYLSKKEREQIIQKIASSKFPLDADELHQLGYAERKAYAKARFKSKWGYLMRVFTVKYLDTEDQKKFVEDSLKDGRSLSQEMIDVLKSPARKHYEKLYHGRSANTHLTEAIRKRLSLFF